MTEVLVFWSADDYEKFVIEGDVPTTIYISNKSNNGTIEKVAIDVIYVENPKENTKKWYYVITKFSSHSVDSKFDIYPAIEHSSLKPFNS